MIDWSQLREMIWQARWDAVVAIAQGMWFDMIHYPWMIAIFGLIALTLTRRAWWRLVKFVGGAFIHSHIR